MSKISFIVILGLSVITTYGVAIFYDLQNNSLLAGDGGLPLKFEKSSFMGGTHTNYFILLLDIVFWFIIIWLLWTGLKKLQKGKK